MNRNKYFKIIFIACILAALNGCGPSYNSGPSQNTPAADAKNSYIIIDEVKAIVLENAGLTEENVRFVRLKLVSENSGGKYDVEFVSDTVEYDYMVDAMTGEILSMNCEIGNYDIDNLPSDIAQVENSQDAAPQEEDPQEEDPQTGNQQKTDKPETDKQETDKQTENSQSESVQNSNSQNGTDNQYIGREAAQQAALTHAGLDADAVRFAHTRLEFDDGRWMYDVEFHKGNEEYDYDIDALTGEILSYDYDAEYINSGASAAQSGEYITQDEAKQIALAYAGISESDAQYLKVEFDYDDRRAEYEVEWNVGRTEYSCDVNAYTGEILSFDKELD